MLYPKNKQVLTQELFKNPTSEYRGAPFWAWNSKLNKEDLIEQIDNFKIMGIGGFHIHSRTGLAIDYLSDEFFDLVKLCNEKAKKEEMLCWLYDEDRWPSGFAGGYVTKNDEYRQRFIIFTPFCYDDSETVADHLRANKRVVQGKKRKLLARYEIVLENGYLTRYKRLKDNEKSKDNSKIWYAYLEIAADDPWFNNQAYADTLNKKAIEKFVEITHEKYF